MRRVPRQGGVFSALLRKTLHLEASAVPGRVRGAEMRGAGPKCGAGTALLISTPEGAALGERRDDGGDGPFFIETGDDSGTAHEESIILNAPEIEAKFRA